MRGGNRCCLSQEGEQEEGQQKGRQSVHLKTTIISALPPREGNGERAYVSSQPSLVERYFVVATPAFSITISKRSNSFSATNQPPGPQVFVLPLLANALTLSKLAKSSSQVSTTPGVTRVVSLIYRTALAPLALFRQARISFRGLNLARCFAASTPKPVFAPNKSIVLLS